jgi:DNA-binding response OmpR family regulator
MVVRMMKSKILIVDSDKMLLEILTDSFLKENHIVMTATDGLQALEEARIQKPDIIIIEIMIPKLSGLEVCRILRKEMIVPIFILTNSVEEIDKLLALELGADDYMTKPFNLRELIARIRAMQRRMEIVRKLDLSEQEIIPQLMRVANLTIDVCSHCVFRGESVIKLTPTEFKLLGFLARKRGQVVSREHLIKKVWGYDCNNDSRILDFHIRSLRQKIEHDPPNPVHLVTVRGVGFKFKD